MTESEIRHTFASIDETTPIWVAINQLLSEALAETYYQMDDPSLAKGHGELAYTVGGSAYLKAFKAHLDRRFEETHVQLNVS